MSPQYFSEEEVERLAKARDNEIMDERIAKMDDGPERMSTMERFANNMLTIVIARAAMIVTPVLLAFFAWAAVGVWNQLEARVSATEADIKKHTSTIQDHESRLVFGRSQREEFQRGATDQFKEINSTLKELNAQIGIVNGSLIRMQTTIENRLPPRGSSEESPQ